MSNYEAEREARAERQHERDMELRRQITKIGVGVVVGILLLVGFFMYMGPKYTLYKANTTKQSVIKEQQARSEAAEFEARSRVTQAEANADAERIEAEGLADAQEIIDSTLTPEYLRYLYIKALEKVDGQVIYVPTEAGLPVTEAGRATEEPPTTESGG